MIQSTATKYAIRAVCYLAYLGPGARAQAREIAEELSIPQAFLSKILQELSCSPTETSLYSLVQAVEGPLPEGECLLGLSLCSDETKCPIHDTWREICESFRERMMAISLMDVVEADQLKKEALESPWVAEAAL